MKYAAIKRWVYRMRRRYRQRAAAARKEDRKRQRILIERTLKELRAE